MVFAGVVEGLERAQGVRFVLEEESGGLSGAAIDESNEVIGFGGEGGYGEGAANVRVHDL